jgi:tetratricopeptide (TPR) repeat protein
LCGQRRYQQAVGYHQQASALFHDLGNRPSEADALNGTGEALAALDRIDEARVQHRGALALAREVRDLYQEARAHRGLGAAYHYAGNSGHARYHWERAFARYSDIGVPEAEQVRATLDSLASAAP